MAEHKNPDNRSDELALDRGLALVAGLRAEIVEAARQAVREALSDHGGRRTFLRRGLRPTPSPRSSREWAALRRGEAAALAAQLEAFPREVNDDTFAFYIDPIESRLRDAINRLSDAEQVEGNTLMILDQILETLLNDERGCAFRDERARPAVAGILRALAQAETVTGADVRCSYRALKQAGLNPSAPITLDTRSR